MIAETVVFQGLRMVSASLDDVPHRRRNASYPDALKNAIRIHTQSTGALPRLLWWWH